MDEITTIPSEPQGIGKNILGFEMLQLLTAEQAAKIEAAKRKEQKTRNIGIYAEVEEAINSKLYSYPQLINVLAKLNKVSMSLAAGREPGASVSKADECCYTIQELLKTARELGFPIAKMENTGHTVYQYSETHWKSLNKEIVRVMLSLAAYKMGIR